jgi:hypothetical protein
VVHGLLAALVLAGSCDAGLLGISHSSHSELKGKSGAYSEPQFRSPAQTGGDNRPPAVGGGAFRAQSQLQAGLGGGDAMISRPLAGPGPRAASHGAGGSPTPGALARGPITGISKRQQAWLKRAPTPESKDRAASEISMAVGELEGLQMDIADRKYMNNVLGISTGPAKANSEQVKDEKKLNSTLSAFGRKQRAVDLALGLAGRYRTRRPTPDPVVTYGRAQNSTTPPRNSTLFSPLAFGRPSAAAQTVPSEGMSGKQALMRQAFAPSPGKGDAAKGSQEAKERGREGADKEAPAERQRGKDASDATEEKKTAMGGKDARDATEEKKTALGGFFSAAAASFLGGGAQEKKPGGEMKPEEKAGAGKLEESPGSSVGNGDTQGKASESKSPASKPRPQGDEEEPNISSKNRQSTGEARASAGGQEREQKEGKSPRETQPPSAKPEDTKEDTKKKESADKPSTDSALSDASRRDSATNAGPGVTASQDRSKQTEESIGVLPKSKDRESSDLSRDYLARQTGHRN